MRPRITKHGEMCGSSKKTRANCAYELRKNDTMRPTVHMHNCVRIKCLNGWVTISKREYAMRKESFRGWTNIEVYD